MRESSPITASRTSSSFPTPTHVSVSPSSSQTTQASPPNDEELRKNLPAYKTITFAGGGAKGIGHLGVLSAIGDENLKNVKKVSGASAGAMNALAVSLNLPVQKIINFTKTQSIQFNSETIREQIKALIDSTRSNNSEDQSTQGHGIDDPTFEDLQTLFPDMKELFISASWVSKHLNIKKEVIFSSKNTPKMPVSLAVLASASIPLLMERVKLEPEKVEQYFSEEYIDEIKYLETHGVMKLMDGGVTNNMPVHSVLDDKVETQHLVLSFADNENMHERPLSVSERLKDQLVRWNKGNMPTIHPYRDRQSKFSEISNDEKHTIEVYYSNPGVGTTDAKKAMKNMNEIIEKVKYEFLDQHTKATPTSTPESASSGTAATSFIPESSI